MLKRFLLAAALATGIGSAASAVTVGFNFTISGSTNVPTFTLENTSTDGLQLLSFNFTIGDTARNFDYVQNITAPAGGTATLNIGDPNNGGARTDVIELGFTSFDQGDTASFRTDIDQDNSNTTRDYRNTFFNNGGDDSNNSVVTATFSNDIVLQFFLIDPPAGRSEYNYVVSANLSAIPLPASLPLALAGLGILGWVGRRKV